MTTRKYLSEFALNMRVSQTIILQQAHLHELKNEDFEPDHCCHIYAIARRPRLFLDMDLLNITPQKLEGVINAQHRDQLRHYEFSIPNFSPHAIAKCKCEYPYTEFSFFDMDGRPLLEGSVAQFFLSFGAGRTPPELLDLEVLYVGQAYGEDGDRMAPQRLGKHETLQKIYADAIRRRPDMDVWLILYSFEEILLVSFDGRSKHFGTTDNEDLKHMEKVLATPISEAQRINYTEAALIRYFQPEYNTIFKDSFPTPNHTSYSECYDLDLNSVTVEIDSTEIGCRLWSEAANPAWNHLPSFPLHSVEERRSMFEFVNEVKP